MKKKAYSLKALDAKSSDLIAAEAGGSSVAVGIDVAKRELVLMVRCVKDSPAASVAFSGPFRVGNPDGIGLIVALMKRLLCQGPASVAMESSGTYGDCLRQALSEAGIVLQKVHSKQSHDYAEVFDGVPSQHDGKDAAVIAELCAIGKCGPWFYHPCDETLSRMKMLVEWIDGQDRISRLWIGRIEALLARHWPEATRTMDLSSGTLLRTLRAYGGPEPMVKDPQALQKLRRWGGPWLDAEKAAALLASAKTTLGVKQNHVDHHRVKRCAAGVHEAMLEVHRSQRELKKLGQPNPIIQRQAGAVGIVTATVLWTCVGDPRNYPSAPAYRKAMGLNLTERSSGQCKGRLRLSKRGDRLVRRWLHLAALRLIQRHPSIAGWYRQKRLRDGGDHLGALTAVVRRLAIALHKIAVNDQAFDPQRLFTAAAIDSTAAVAAGGR